MQRGIDYIESNLHYGVQPAQVARHAGISTWHFQRIFKALTNETLKGYIRSRRFAEALTALETTSTRIIEVAGAAGFDSQQSFTRAFQQAFGLTPAQSRRTPGAVPRPRKVRLDREYLEHLHGGVTLEPEIVDLSALHLAGMRTRFYGPESEKNNMSHKLEELWAGFMPFLPELPHRADAESGYGVLQDTGRAELTYWAAVPVLSEAKVPMPFTSMNLPAARYARFEHRGDVRSLDFTVNYIYSNWLLRSGMRHTYGCDLEFYDRRYVPGSTDSVISYLIPVSA